MEAEDFKKALKLLRDLADLQNGPPLETVRDEWEETMEEVWEFLYKWEIENQTIRMENIKEEKARE